MFEIEMLPAREGDCLWLRYGSAKAPRQILIDGGRSSTYTKDLRGRLLALPPAQRAFELFVITHVDRDHIEGALDLLEDDTLPVRFNQIWFNGYDHLRSAKIETFGAVQGERLTTALLKRKAVWNRGAKGKAIRVRGSVLPTLKLPGGMTLTILSPDRQKLIDLIPDWIKECEDANLVPGVKARRRELKGLEAYGALNVETLAATPFNPDRTTANGTSIALLARYRGKRALLGADAHVDRLVASLKLLRKGSKRFAIDVLKVPHHGSERNLSKELLEGIECPLYLVSTNGAYSKHPRPIVLARILKYGGDSKTIAFNYSSKFTRIWNQAALKTAYRYDTIYPGRKSNGTLVVRLLD